MNARLLSIAVTIILALGLARPITASRSLKATIASNATCSTLASTTAVKCLQFNVAIFTDPTFYALPIESSDDAYLSAYNGLDTKVNPECCYATGNFSVNPNCPCNPTVLSLAGQTGLAGSRNAFAVLSRIASIVCPTLDPPIKPKAPPTNTC